MVALDGGGMVIAMCLVHPAKAIGRPFPNLSDQPEREQQQQPPGCGGAAPGPLEKRAKWGQHSCVQQPA